jgi:hypothetical protein
VNIYCVTYPQILFTISCCPAEELQIYLPSQIDHVESKLTAMQRKLTLLLRDTKPFYLRLRLILKKVFCKCIMLRCL